uniref:Uncharacterized protein n=1 Tax=Octopus bimaculoides TaxID=37653 RepID=A0A0L8I1E3_OCTBM
MATVLPTKWHAGDFLQSIFGVMLNLRQTVHELSVLEGRWKGLAVSNNTVATATET